MEVIDKQYKFAQELANSVDMYILPFGLEQACQTNEQIKGFGKRLIKKFRCSPDAYVQLALQLANYRDQVRVITYGYKEISGVFLGVFLY